MFVHANSKRDFRITLQKKRKFTRLQIVSRSGSIGERKAGHNPREGNKSEARGQYPRGQARGKLSTSLVT